MLADILAKGYFPAELPPCFDTKGFSKAVSGLANLPPGFLKSKQSQLCNVSLARAGNARFRRRLSLINPMNFFELAVLVTTNWAALDAKMRTSKLTRSRAVHRPNQARALSPLSYSPSNLVDIRAKTRGVARVLLMADISEFYHSIYTHSIPWALHTKTFAKANQNAKILGNLLDKSIQRGQHGQTVGIPIGPDTSLVIAEILLADLEQRVRVRIPDLTGFRFVDDFELSFPDHATAEQALAILQEELLHYELRLNGRKTSLRIPPVGLESDWVSELRRYTIRDNHGQRGDLVGYFDLMTRLLLTHPNDHVSKYGLKRFRSFNPRKENVEMLQSMLCHTCVAEPGSAREVVEALLNLRNLKHKLDQDVITNSLSAVLRTSTPLGHHYESAWALWGVINLKIVLDAQTVAALNKTDNSVVAILALDANAKGLTPSIDVSRWAARMTAPDLREDEWLLSYEANVHGWLPTVGGGDHVAGNPEFGFLKANAVHFYKP